MAYTRQAGREFWYDFDNQTLFRRTPEMSDAMFRAYFSHQLTFDSVMESLRKSLASGDHPQPLLAVVDPGRDGFIDLARLQFEVMRSHLADADEIRAAFEDFGQGVLYDDRSPRPPGRRVHMMDGTRDSWVGYHRWHAFARCAVLLSGQEDPWLHIDRCIALAWAIQTEANPEMDRQDNPELPAERLADLRSAWLAMSAEDLDRAFSDNRFRAPRLGPSPTQLSGYARVQVLLGAAAGELQPFHDGYGRFWELPYDQFMALPAIYGEQLIAPIGPDRGADSALVKVLRGQLVNFPQMPLNRPPMRAADIDFIQKWIDDGCPRDAPEA